MTKLLVRNLARETTEATLIELCKAFGEVVSCTIVKDEQTGASKGFGFVIMKKPGEAKVATKALNGKRVDESIIRVKKAEKKKEAPVAKKELDTTPRSEKGEDIF